MNQVAVGRVTVPHGVKGWVKVQPLTDDMARFDSIKRVLLSGKRPSGLPDFFDITDFKFQNDRILLKFEGVESREDADKLRSIALYIPESEVPPIEEENTFYFYQLEGMEVRDAAGIQMGKLDTIYRTGSNDIYRIISADGKTEYYAPAIKTCIISVDVDAGIMIVDRNWLT